MSLLEQLKKLQTYKKSKSFYAEKLGISIEEVDELMKELKGTNIVDEGLTYTSPSGSQWNTTYSYEDFSKKENIEKGTLETTSVTNYEPKDIDELMILHKVDPKKYKVKNYYSKQRGDKFFATLFSTLRTPNDFSPEEFATFLKGYKSDYKPSKIKNSIKIEEVDVEISLADFHLDKLDLSGETIEDRKEQYKTILTSLIERVDAGYDINKIVFVTGNDFLHTDTYNTTTTKGTPLESSTTWNNAYEEGFDLMVWAISTLKEYCSWIEVILVNGNHDRTKSYYLTHALSIYFAADENIGFDRSDDPIKYTTVGDTFIGYNHGDGKMDELPLIFATDRNCSVDFGASKYREIHTGDKHHYLVKEIKGVRIQQLPSLAGTDRWHRDHQFVNNIRAALALVYHPTKGRVAEIEERIEI